jgi:hypothetical protein
MDIDAACMGNLTEIQKANLIKENKCFYCQKTRHRTSVCFKKKCNQGEITKASHVNTINTDTTQTEAAKMVHRIIGKMMDKEKLKLVKDLLPKDFLQGTN